MAARPASYYSAFGSLDMRQPLAPRQCTYQANDSAEILLSNTDKEYASAGKIPSRSVEFNDNISAADTT